MLTRMYVGLTLLGMLPLLVGAQVVWLYLNEGEELQSRGERQANSSVEIPALRGAIYDQAGRALAINTARYDLALDPTIEGFEEQSASFFDNLSALTGRSASYYRRRVQQRSSEQYVLLQRSLTEPQKEEIDSWDVPGLILTPRFARRYNYSATASHVLGYVSSDGNGLEGVERQYDDFLKGTPGRRAVKRDRHGRIRSFVGGEVVEPEHGGNLVLTVDLVRQTILEEELARGVEETGAQWGTAIAMDPHTGAIMAMSSMPTYDPNRPGSYSSDERRNRGITDRIEPGSTFKLVTAVAAMEAGVVSLEDSLETDMGYAVVDGRPLHDTRGYGTISFADVIALSSNIGTAKVAQRLEPAQLYTTARSLGFGVPTWIDLPGEVGGRLKKPDEWSRPTRSSLSIGYEVAVTPLQVLTAYAALANGGLLVHPHLVAERQDVLGQTVWQASRTDSVRRAFSEETARRLLPAFERVVEQGTAEQAQVENLRIAGKTGTAIKPVNGSYNSGRYRASFVGFFPAEDPAVAMIVVLDEPQTSIYGGATAGPIFRRIAQRWAGTLPQVAAGMAPPDTLRPAPEEETPQVTRIAFEDGASEEEEEAVMPDLRGLGARQAVFALARRGIEARVEGQGQVQDQHPAPGAPLPELVVLRCAREAGP